MICHKTEKNGQCSKIVCSKTEIYICHMFQYCLSQHFPILFVENQKFLYVQRSNIVSCQTNIYGPRSNTFGGKIEISAPHSNIVCNKTDKYMAHVPILFVVNQNIWLTFQYCLS